MKQKIMSVVICTLVWFCGVTYGQTDYILQNLHSAPDRCNFMSPNNPTYVGFSIDSMCVMSWALPPVLTPGMQCKCIVKWKFWTSSNPVSYMNYFGNWQPNTELAQSSMYGGIPSCDEEFIDVFTFTVPSTPGWYRIRFFGRLDFSPMTCFYGKSNELAGFFSEILFHSGYDLKTEESDVFPSTYGVSQNFPNPARVRTTIQYQIPAESDVRITIYNTAGQIVKTLINGERKRAGNYTVDWDRRDNEGKEVSPGTYFYTLDVNGKTTTRKAVIVE